MLDENGYYRIRDDVKAVLEPNGNRCMLIDLANGTWIGLGRRTYEIVEECDGCSSLGELCDRWSGEALQVRRQLMELFGRLHKICYLVTAGESTPPSVPDIEECYFMLTRRCNLRCTHCSAQSGPSCVHELTTRQVLRIIDRIAAEVEPERLVLSGGEPLTRERFPEILQHARQVFSGELILQTNAVLIDMETARLLRRNGVNMDISLDGIDEESCRPIRGRGTFAQVMRGIEHLKEAGYLPEEIKASLMVNRHLAERADDVFAFAEKEGLRLYFRAFVQRGRGKENATLECSPEQRRGEGYKRLVNTGDIAGGVNLGRAKEICHLGIRRLAVAADGGLYPCIQLADNPRFVMGSTLDEERLTEQAISFLQTASLDSYKVDQIPACRACDVRYFCQEVKCVVRHEDAGERTALMAGCEGRREWIRRIIWDTRPDLGIFGLDKMTV